MATLKERLQARADVHQTIVELATAGGEKVEIRRLLVSERNKLVDRFGIGQKDGAAKATDEKGITYGIALVALSLVPPMTEEDVLSLPAAIADELADKIMTFNGWTERSRKELADQFRASA